MANMIPEEIADARLHIGLAWGLKRPLSKAEFGDLLGYQDRDPGNAIANWERGDTRVPGPAALAIQALLDGWRPADWQRVLRDRKSLPRGAK
jgi:hypothetical protein